MFIVKAFKIIVTHSINKLCTILSTLCHHIIRSNCNRGIFLRIMHAHTFLQVLCYFYSPANMGIINLVTNRPHYKTWMISIMANPICCITLAPFVKIVSVIKRSLRLFPHIKYFIINKETHFIAQIHPGSRRRIMRRADRINSHFFESCKLSSESSFIKSSPQSPLIMMLAGPLYFYMPAV